MRTEPNARSAFTLIELLALRLRSGQKGFTLIELLVVITIIVVLLSLLTPALDRGIAAAEAAVCGSNQRNMGFVFHAYGQDYRRVWIAPWDLTNYQGTAGEAAPNEWYTWTVGIQAGSWAWQWPYVMAIYAANEKPREVGGRGTAPGYYAWQFVPDDAKGYMYCPTLSGQGLIWPGAGGFTTWSYGMIGRGSQTGAYDLTGYPRARSFRRPGQTVHLQDMAWTSDGTGEPTEPTPNAWANFNSLATDPHGGQSNYLFADGSVARLEHRWSRPLDGSATKDRERSDLIDRAYEGY